VRKALDSSVRWNDGLFAMSPKFRAWFSSPFSGSSPEQARRAEKGAKTRHFQHGFTLLEMLAVILLIGIAASAVAISVTHGLASARINAASGELAAALRATRAQAIVHGAQRNFVLDTRDARYHGASGREVQLPHGMRVGITSASMDQGRDGTARIRFFPDGSSTGGRITLQSGQRQWHVNVSWLTGAVNVVDVVKQP
jgi:general secretion pathway protein H